MQCAASADQLSEENVFVVSRCSGKGTLTTVSSGSGVAGSSSSYSSSTVVVPERDETSSGYVAKIKCSVKSADTKVEWLRDDKSLLALSDTQAVSSTPPSAEAAAAENDKYRMLEEGNERVLVVNNVQTDDEGEYVCQSGKYRTALYLMVHKDDVNDNDEASRLSIEQLQQQQTATPDIYFLDKGDTKDEKSSSSEVRRDIFVHEGAQQVALKCGVRDARLDVDWLRRPLAGNGSVVSRLLDENDSAYEMVRRDNERSLVIKHPSVSDTAEYICRRRGGDTDCHADTTKHVIFVLHVASSSHHHRTSTVSGPSTSLAVLHVDTNDMAPSTVGGGDESDRLVALTRRLTRSEQWVRRTSTTSGKGLLSTSKTVLTSPGECCADNTLTFYEKQNAALTCLVKSGHEHEPVEWARRHVRERGGGETRVPIELGTSGSGGSGTGDKYAATQQGDVRTLTIRDLSQTDSGNYFCYSPLDPMHHAQFEINVKGITIVIQIKRNIP